MRFDMRTRRFPPLAVLGLVGSCLLVLSAQAADWPRFRGPNGTGIAADKDVPVEFGNDKNILWKVEIVGRGHSSPIVSKGRIFLQSSSDDQIGRYLICLDAATGKTIWSKAFPGGVARTHTKNTPASNTPAADGQRVYAVVWDGSNQRLTAWDYDGKLLWNRDLGPLRSEHGSGISPIVVGDRVIINNDQGDQKVHGPSAAQAFDAKTGEPVWSKDRDPERACYSTPFLLEPVDGTPEVIVVSTGGVTAYDPKDGTQIWNYVWNFDPKGKGRLRTVGSPIEHQGLIFANSGDGAGDRHMVALKPNGKGAPPTLVWEKKKGTAYVPAPLAKDGYVFWVGDKENVAVCAEAKTGKEIWSERLGSGSVTASPVMIDGKIYTITEEGKVIVYAAAPTFDLLATNELHEGVYASPAVADGRLYIRGVKHLFCIAKK
jgi:outer membrane protein assembly factor BamB